MAFYVSAGGGVPSGSGISSSRLMTGLPCGPGNTNRRSPAAEGFSGRSRTAPTRAATRRFGILRACFGCLAFGQPSDNLRGHIYPTALAAAVRPDDRMVRQGRRDRGRCQRVGEQQISSPYLDLPYVIAADARWGCSDDWPPAAGGDLVVLLGGDVNEVPQGRYPDDGMAVQHVIFPPWRQGAVCDAVPGGNPRDDQFHGSDLGSDTQLGVGVDEDQAVICAPFGWYRVPVSGRDQIQEQRGQ